MVRVSPLVTRVTDMTITRILVPSDFSRDADAALAYAIELAKPFHAAVRLLHVVETPLAAGMWATECYTAEIAGLQINLVRDAKERVRQATTAFATPVRVCGEVRVGPPDMTIVDTATEEGADLIVMGTAGRTGLAHLLMGSVAEKVVRFARCPVLTIRAAPDDSRARVAAAPDAAAV